MRPIKRILFLGVLALLAGGSLAIAHSDAVTITWYAITAGGGTGSGADLTLRGALGHWSTHYMSGGAYRLRPDFLGPHGASAPPPPPEIRLYLPSVLGSG